MSTSYFQAHRRWRYPFECLSHCGFRKGAMLNHHFTDVFQRRGFAVHASEIMQPVG